MRGVTRKYASDLRLVFHLSELKDPHDGIDIVICPDLWAYESQEKTVKPCPWLKLLVASTDHDTRVFIFRYHIAKVDDGSVWYHLLALAPQLLDALRQAKPTEFERRPLLFICHGLGGIILKHAIYLAQRDYPAIQNALSGIIFLGTPHLTSINDDRWKIWPLLLRAIRSGNPKSALREQDIELLVGVCQKFRGANLQVQIISVYETKSTRIRGGGLLGRLHAEDIVLVDRSHATTKAQYEELIGADSSHMELHTIEPGTPLFSRITTYLNKAPLIGQECVLRSYERLTVAIDFSDEISQRSQTDDASLAEIDSCATREAEKLDPPDSTRRPKRGLLPCYSLGTSRNQNFFGQDKILDAIDQALLPHRKTDDALESHGSCADGHSVALLKTFAICGMGGLGKTEIAVEYIHTRKAEFDAIFWVNSANLDKLNVSFQDISIKLGLLGTEDVLHSDPTAVRDIVKAWLVEPTRRLTEASDEQENNVSWLLVFDNADDPDILYDFIPPDGHGSVLITSRTPLGAQMNAFNLRGLDLSPMTIQDAGRFLQKMCGREKEPSSLETCSSIAERLDGLPLAIVQMAHIIRSKHLSLTEFQEYYQHDAKKFQATPVPGLTQNQTLASVWNIESLPSPSISLLRVLSVLDADAIPEDVLVKGASRVKLDDYPNNRIAYFEAREELLKSSLITRNVENGFLRIHRLVQDVVRQKLSLLELRAVYNAGVTLVSAVWPFLNHSNLGNVDRMRIVQHYLSHVIALRVLVEEQTPVKLQPTIEISALFNEASWYYSIQLGGIFLRDSMALASLSQQVLEVGSEYCDNDQLLTRLLADAYRFQAITGMYMNDPRAFPCCKKWMEILVDRVQKYQQPEDIKVMPIAYNELGKAYMQISNEEEALKSFVMACDILDRTVPATELPFPHAWMNRALIAAFNHCNGDMADSLLWPVVKRRMDKLGKNDTSTLDTGILLSHMGQIRQTQGRSDEAYEFYKQGVDLLKVAAGESVKYTIEASYRLAVAEFDRGNYKAARDLLEKVAAYYRGIPWHKSEEARSAWKLGRTLKAEDNDKCEEEIEKLLNRAMCLRHELVPNDDRGEHELVDVDWDKLVFFVWR